MHLVYLENSPGACTWSWYAVGLAGPDGPNSVSNVHNGGWKAALLSEPEWAERPMGRAVAPT